MLAKKKKVRQYLIDLHTRRSRVALAACSVTAVCCYIAMMTSFILYTNHGWDISSYFHYFTTISNMLTALASFFIFPYAVNGIRKKRFVYPRWLSLFFYSGVTCTTLTFIFAMFIILPYDRKFAIGGSNFYLHIICPIAVLISFNLVESYYRFTRKDALICLIPFVLYSVLYVYKVVVVGPENGGWEDMYKLNTFVPIWFSVPATYALTFVIACVLRIVANKLSDKREKQLMSCFPDELSEVELKIEIFGLGRYNGLRDEEWELSVPMDIIKILADKYSLNTEDLTRVYVKGAINAMRERGQKE